ncbi:hypothetical protein Skr01_02810 [Sphaerisporangium krabiense]|uniref:Uncharacterized protein n=1 Tax=Sphaerisporangium krabiense TaxID=763782 RepID=A0A7W8Z7J4_9ACTN|nr:hypothetical protein [Sphaerisporangium krabiense]MBB5628964.1 hypothetical protein [Sphaerisporangium krabiense]GII60196.1 hypothetical protein Skr01_02810 [Sphaerisporangium krabiense]
MREETQRLLQIQDDFERFRAATRMLVDLDDLILEISRIRNESASRMQISPVTPQPRPDESLPDDARAVLECVRRMGEERFRRRDVFRRLARRFKTVAAMVPALDLLEAAGYIRKVEPATEPGHPGRRRSPEYEVRL